MGILLQIGLTIWAWKAGWKAWALVPGGCFLAIGFMLGFVENVSGVVLSEMAGIFALGQHVALMALALMVATGSRDRKSQVLSEADISIPPNHVVHQGENTLPM